VNGIHDIGGMHGFGPVERDEAVFHAQWEKRQCARR
jgi:nitrile hydratase